MSALQLWSAFLEEAGADASRFDGFGEMEQSVAGAMAWDEAIDLGKSWDMETILRDFGRVKVSIQRLVEEVQHASD